MDTGTGGANFILPKRKVDSELSTIDTALLVLGALTAGEYFGGEVKNKADNLYRSVQWDKFLYTKERADNKGWPWYGSSSTQFFSAWKPGNEYATSLYGDEEGRFSNRSFDRPDEPFMWDYSTDEIMLICLLAIASPTHPVGTNTFYAWNREWGTYSTYSLIQSHPGSLFTYFFAHCWIKFNGLGSDNHPITPINWWENSVNASKANWQYCKDKSYEGWGLTACEGPDGIYYGYGASPCGEAEGPKDDGTLAPYGAGSSIAFIPDKSIQALKHYFKNTDLWRYLFGFGDAYNPHNATVTGYYNGPWYNHAYFGIDQGPMLIGIENYRSGLVWNYFMENGYIREALPKIFYSSIPPAFYSIKGNVKDSDDKGISYVNVVLSGDKSAIYWTREDGYYEFTDLPSGSYTVTPVSAYWKEGVEPISRNYSPLDHDCESQDFKSKQPPKSEITPVHNLFNPAKGEHTTIVYKLDKRCHVITKLYDLLGEPIITLVDENKDAGSYSIDWFGKNEEGSRVASGTYLLYFKAGDYKRIEKVIVIK